MVIKKRPVTATRTRTAPAPAASVKKRTAAPAPAKKTVPAKRAAAPVAKKSVPAPRKTTAVKKAAQVKPTAKESPSTKAVSSYDVLAAGRAAEIAQARYEEMKKAFWAGQDGAIEGAAEHAKMMADQSASEVPAKRGRPATKEGPARKALAPQPTVIDEYYDEDAIRAYSIVDLRALANELADKEIITERKIKGVIYEQMEAAGLFREGGSQDADEDAEDDDEVGEEGEEDFDEYEDDEAEAADSADDESDDEEDDGGDDEDTFTVEGLKAMSLKKLQELAEKWGIPWKGLTQKQLVASIIEAGSEDDEESDEETEDEEPEEEFEDEDEAADEEEDEEEEEYLEISLEDIEAMNTEQLLKILGQLDVRIPSKSKNDADALRELLLSVVEDQGDDEEE